MELVTPAAEMDRKGNENAMASTTSAATEKDQALA
jgi:hypothetical protein